MLFRLFYIIYIPLICLAILHPAQAMPVTIMKQLGLFMAGGWGAGFFIGSQVESKKKEILKIATGEAVTGLALGLATGVVFGGSALSQPEYLSRLLMFLAPTVYRGCTLGSSYFADYVRQAMGYTREAETKQKLETIAWDSPSVLGMN